MTKPLILYPFRLRDAVTGKWYRARWVAELHEIEKLGGVVDGEPEIRERTDGAGFQPYRNPPKPIDRVELHPHRAPGIDAFECGLTRLFLRRYVTYCTRRGRYAQASGAAALWRELRRA
jgi:hypothetical protein